MQQGHGRTERRVHPALSARFTVSALPRPCLDRSAEDPRAAATHAARASPPAAGGIARPPPPEIRTKPAPQAGNPLHALNLMRLNTKLNAIGPGGGRCLSIVSNEAVQCGKQK